jgi:tryptophan synthase alpha chain
MSRLGPVLETLRARDEAALVPFIMAGDPDLDTTLRLALGAAAAGADALEIGVPFSDPTADGPVLQRSAERALKKGVSLPRVLGMVSEFRRQSELPLILFGYYNPIFHYGPERFARDAVASGADGCLVVDLPPEEADELQRFTDPAGLDFVFLIAPTSGPERVRHIVRRARGFVYYVSLTGVTGARTTLPENLEPAIAALRKQTTLPIGVGFGISSPEQAAAVSAFSDVVIVGSALMRLVEEHGASGQAVEEVSAFIRSLKAAMRKPQKKTA